MKKLAVILILGLFLYNIAGHYPVHKAMQYQIRKQVKRITKKSLKYEELEIIKIPVSYIKKGHKDFKLIHSKEFRLKGKLYDIIDQKQEGDTLILLCINDRKEEQLIRRYLASNDVNTSPNQKTKNTRNLIKIIISEAIPDQELDYFLELFSIIKHFENSFKINQSAFEVISPPPELFS